LAEAAIPQATITEHNFLANFMFSSLTTNQYVTTVPTLSNPATFILKGPWLSVLASQQVWLYASSNFGINVNAAEKSK
jgi:hypothetical protein